MGRSRVHGFVGSTHRLRTQSYARWQAKQIGSHKAPLLACGLPCLSKLGTARDACELPRQRSLVLAAANFCLLLLLRLVDGEVLGVGRITRRAEL